MRIYLAGSSREAAMVASYMARVRSAGHSVTLDWTVPVLAATIPDRDMPEPERARHADMDFLAVARADVFWLLTPETPSTGAWTELGIALGRGIRIIASGDWRKNLFTAIVSDRFDTHEEALSALLAMRAA